MFFLSKSFVSLNYESTHKVKSGNRFDDLAFEQSPSDFKELIISNQHSTSAFIDNKRNEKSFIKMKSLIVDFDSKNGETNTTIEEFMKSDFADKFNYILYSSRSHQLNGNGDCFHVLIPLSETIEDLTIAKACIAMLGKELDYMGLKYDKNAFNSPSRYINPSRNSGETHLSARRRLVYHTQTDKLRYSPRSGLDYQIIEEEYMARALKATQSKTARVVENDPMNYQVDVNTSEYDNGFDVEYQWSKTFYILSRKNQLQLVRSMMRTVNRMNAKSGWTRLSDSKTWYRIGASLFNLFGYDDGFKLFHTLSAGFKSPTSGYFDSYKRIKANYDIIARSRDKLIGFSLLMENLRKIGFFTKSLLIKTFEKELRDNYDNHDLIEGILAEYAKKHNVEAARFTYISLGGDIKSKDAFIERVDSDGCITFHRFFVHEFKDLMAQMLDVDRGSVKLRYISTLINIALEDSKPYNIMGEILEDVFGKIITNKRVFEIDGELIKCQRDTVVKKYDGIKKKYTDKVMIVSDITKAYQNICDLYQIPREVFRHIEQTVIDRLMKYSMIISTKMQRRKIKGSGRVGGVVVIQCASDTSNKNARIECANDTPRATSNPIYKVDSEKYDELGVEVLGVNNRDVVTLSDKESSTDHSFKMKVDDLLKLSRKDMNAIHRLFGDNRILAHISNPKYKHSYIEWHWILTNPKWAKGIRAKQNEEAFRLYKSNNKLREA